VQTVPQEGQSADASASSLLRFVRDLLIPAVRKSQKLTVTHVNVKSIDEQTMAIRPQHGALGSRFVSNQQLFYDRQLE
jgi:hypothetical protein